MICSVCIATYKRPTLLEQTLASILAQVLPHDIIIETIVVDNDPERSAAGIVEKHHDTDSISFKYFSQPIKNISLTRNMAVHNASGTYLVLIDDDEVASPRWIATLLKAADKYGADGVFGPVLPIFDKSAPEWLVRGERLFVGTIPATPTGSPATFTWSGNCLLKNSVLTGVSGPFDPSYGITGGEDTELFDRLRRGGARFIYCNEAPVFEHWPAARTRKSYLIKVSLKGGNSYTWRKIAASKWRILKRALFLLKGLCVGALSVCLIIGTLPSKVWRTYWELKFASNAGGLLAVFGHHYEAYK